MGDILNRKLINQADLHSCDQRSLKMLLAVGFFVLAFIATYYLVKHLKNLPPGPSWYRFLANLELLKPTDGHKNLLKLRRQYGDVMCVTKIVNTNIVISGREALRDIFVKNADLTSDRPDCVLQIIGGGLGIVGTSGQFWKIQRTFVLSSLRSLAAKNRNLETSIKEEILIFLSCMETKNGSPYDFRELLTICLSNALSSLVLGTRYDHDDETFLQLISHIHSPIGNNRTHLLNILPVFKYIPGDFFGRKSIRKYFDRIGLTSRPIVEEHRKTFDENNIRDLIDAFLLEQRKHINEKDSTFTDAQLQVLMQNFFIAGTETSVTTIRWLVLYLIYNPEVQRTMHEEINRVIGTSRLPSMEDKTRLPYCQAVINETHRISSSSPLGLPRGVSEEFYYKGHRIPKGATLFPNLVSAAMDPEVFPNPEKFDPSRFIDKDGKFIAQDSFYPFSIGRRVCPGESFARMGLLLFCTALVQRFELLPVNPDQLPTLEGIRLVTYSPQSYEIKAVKRT